MTIVNLASKEIIESMAYLMDKLSNDLVNKSVKVEEIDTVE